MKKDPRDWMLEIEDIHHHNTISSLAIRNWRDETPITKLINKPLYCVFEKQLKTTLRIVSKWGFEHNSRLHFEWVWDHYNIYLVQADQEQEKSGLNPTERLQDFKDNSVENLNILTLIREEHAKKYQKIDNVFIYQKLGLPSVPLYILEDQQVIQDLANGNISKNLKDDLSQLINRPLVIRTDIASTNKDKRQMLPREEKRDLESSITWLKNTAKKLFERNDLENIEIAFIFHNFIPAVSSAFAYARPNERNVQIVSLWGLPEGLYFYTHDKHVVDTKKQKISNLVVDNFDVKSKENYKNFFVVPDNDGKWNTKIVSSPYDWGKSLSNEEWLKKIALDSRKIVEEVGKSLSIMWFLNVPEEVCEERIFPWHHEVVDLKSHNTNKKHRTKSPHDKSITIKTNNDLLKLEEETKSEHSFIKKINIQPTEDVLLRDKDILQKIGKYAKELNAIIILEGSLLSHAYYQLIQTGATVETYNNFENFEDIQEFNKLVRDDVPQNIEGGGEIVNIVELEKESIIRALKDKLIEEAFEVLDADSDDEVLAELADIYEVVDGLIHHLNISKEKLLSKQLKKREKVGGFENGLVLLETKNPLFEAKEDVELCLFSEEELHPSKKRYEQLPKKDFDKYRDKRELTDTYQDIIRLSIPYTKDYWSTVMDNILINDKNTKITISGKRIDSDHQIEIDIFSKKDITTQQVFNFED